MIDHNKKNYVIYIVTDKYSEDFFFTTGSRLAAFEFLRNRDGYWTNYKGKLMERPLVVDDLKHNLVINDPVNKERVTLTIERGETNDLFFKKVDGNWLLMAADENTILYYKYSVSGIYEPLKFVSMTLVADTTYWLVVTNLITNREEKYFIDTILPEQDVELYSTRSEFTYNKYSYLG